MKITELLEKEPLVVLLFFSLGAAADVWKKGTYMDTPWRPSRYIEYKIYGINIERRGKIVFLLRFNIMKGGHEHD